ncbi:MAG: LytR family transcriptional regulator [Gemmatimonadales bacterium]|nr:MAG: LytR family transcriptional regulator [Gemmatimonadales bacterium]
MGRRSGGRRGGRRKSGQGRRSSLPGALGGLLVLALAGAAIWLGAGLVESDGGPAFLSPESGAVGPGATGEVASEADSPDAGGARPAIPGTDGPRIRVEVLNAGGVRGMASAARDELRDHGFDVVYYGNAPAFGEEHSAVVGRGERSAEADGRVRDVARSLGIGEVRFEADSSRYVEVSVFLGRSWELPADREGAEDDEGAGADPGPVRGWNPLRWFDGDGS